MAGFRGGVKAASFAVLLGLLGVVWMAAPRGIHAQAATPAAAQPAQGEKPAASEQDETNAFRHSAMTQAIARWLHTDVETAARGAEIFNFLVLVFGILIPLYRILPKTLRNRRAALARQIEEARMVAVEAQARMSAVEARLNNLDGEIQGFRAEVERESAGDEARIKAAVEEERARIVASARQEIEQVAAQATRGLKQYAADLAFERAVSQLKLNEETDRELINEFIVEVTNATGGKR